MNSFDCFFLSALLFPYLFPSYQKTNFADSADVSGDSDDITDEEDVLC